MLLRARGINHIHFGKLSVEGLGGKNTAGSCLVIPKDCNSNARFSPNCGMQLGAAETPKASHAYSDIENRAGWVFYKETISMNLESRSMIYHYKKMTAISLTSLLYALQMARPAWFDTEGMCDVDQEILRARGELSVWYP